MLSIFRRSAVPEFSAGAQPCSRKRRLFMLKATSGTRGAVPTTTLEEESELEPRLKVSKVAGDGRCMFRSIARGLAQLSGDRLVGDMEREQADGLRITAREMIRVERREWIEHVGVLEESVDDYCARMGSPDFYGGEPELYLLSSALRRTILVYLQGDSPNEHVKLLEYGGQYSNGQHDKIRLLYNGKNHYDLLQIVAN